MSAYVTVTDPNAEMVRIATELVRLTWLESCLLFNDDEAVLKMTVETAKGWNDAPAGMRKWLDDLKIQK